MITWRLGALGIRLAVALVGVALAAIATVFSVTLIIQKIEVTRLATAQHSQTESAVISALDNAYRAKGTWVGADLEPAIVLARIAGAALLLDAPHESVLLRTGPAGLLGASNTTQVRAQLQVLGRRVGTMRLAFPSLSPSNLRLRTELVAALGISTGLALLATVVVAGLVTPLLVRPISRLTAAVRALEAGAGYTTRGERAGPGELGELELAFDAMSASLRRNEQLRQTMVADLAHELRTPLAILQGEIEAMMDGVRDFSGDALASLHEETLRLGRMVEDLQTLASADAAGLRLERHPVDLASIAASAADSLTGRFQTAGLDLELALSPAVVSADSDRMHQVVVNLLTNAAKFTPRGGRVCLIVRAAEGSAYLEVADTGPGVPPEEQERIFERFFQGGAGRKAGGTGIGLAVAKELVQSHGGEIKLQSSPGGGARFVVRLPRLQSLKRA
jgi:two-component system sensor histidine kinase BaeS